MRLATSRWLRRIPLWVPTFSYLVDNRGKGPDEYQVEAVGEAGYETAVILRVPSGEDACNYYRQALADAGFRVVDQGRNQGGVFDAELDVSNNNLEGNIDFDSDTVEIDLERY